MKLSVITGATGGIGRWIALGLAHSGHELVLIGRDPGRGAAVAAWLTGQVPEARIHILTADLSLLGEVRRVAAQVQAMDRPVDVLVNNAGLFRHRREETAEGHEMVIAVNHLAPFVLTGALLPALQRAGGGARVVNVGSSASDIASIDPDDLEGRRRWGLVHSYAQSKLALLMVTQGWAARLAGTGVVANVVHPGAVATGLVRAGGAIGLVWRAMAPFLLSEAQGADTPLHVALSAEFGSVSGAYVKQRRVARANRRTLDQALCERVWAATALLTGP